jgi:hypothetical protein
MILEFLPYRAAEPILATLISVSFFVCLGGEREKTKKLLERGPFSTRLLSHTPHKTPLSQKQNRPRPTPRTTRACLKPACTWRSASRTRRAS